MPVRRFEPIAVVGSPVHTYVEVRAGDLLEVRATGTVNFGGGFLGIGAPVLGPDGDNYETPPDYPAPGLRKNSLIIGVRSRSYPHPVLWRQGGANRSFAVPVDGYLSLAANDGLPHDNTGGWQVAITITTPDPIATGGVRLSVGRIELVQSMQRTDNSVPLISGKRTLVRVFTNSGLHDGTRVPVEATLECTMGDGSLWRGTVTGDALAEGTHDRNELTSSVNFVVSNISEGEAEFRVSVRRPSEAGSWPGGASEGSLSAPFGRAPIVVFRPFLIELRARAFAPPRWETALAALRETQQRLPLLEGMHILPVETHAYLLPFGDDPSWRNLMYTVGTILGRPSIGEPGQRDYLHVAFIMQPPESRTSGIAMYSPFIWIPSAVCGLGANAGFNAENCAHEVSHALGLNHALCGDPPPPWSSRLPRAIEEPGWDPARGQLVPAGSPEMMTYCGPRWPSIAAYEYVLHGHHA